jgi:hypothetical protein
VENNKTWRGFLKDLGLELVRPHINKRLTIPVPLDRRLGVLKNRPGRRGKKKNLAPNGNRTMSHQTFSP